MLKLSHSKEPKLQRSVGSMNVLERLIDKGLVLRDQATHLSRKPYRYWLSKRGLNVRLLLKDLK